MSIEQNAHSAFEATYKGFACPPAGRVGANRFDLKRLLAGGVVAAAVLGTAMGLVAQPRSAGNSPAASAPAQADRGTAEQVRIVLNPPPAPVALKPGPRLEVLPADMASAAPRPSAAPVQRISTFSAREDGRVGSSLDCRRRQGRAEEIVCADPALRAADRRLARAYEQALRSGVPGQALGGEQEDWLAIRDDAAGYSPQAVSDVYDQRIEELEQMAEIDRP